MKQCPRIGPSCKALKQYLKNNCVKKKKIKTIGQLQGRSYMTCAACMSVWADALSWANKHKTIITKNPKEAENIIVLSCQVTDLAVLNDMRTAENLRRKYPNKKYFISGCLAQRTDIRLPRGIQRLELPKEKYQLLENRTLVNFEKPFWIKDFKEQDPQTKQGHLFRNMYPLRIGKGCPFNCTYCTIRKTRGSFEKYENHKKLIEEFLKFDDTLLIADSPTQDQVKEWCSIAEKYSKQISIRNVEPSVAIRCKKEILNLASKGLLKIFHSPIQSNSEGILKDMNRDVKSTMETIKLAKKLKEKNVYIATNVIIDYKGIKQDLKQVYELYDYVSWNPYWDGKWGKKKAEERFEKYLG